MSTPLKIYNVTLPEVVVTPKLSAINPFIHFSKMYKNTKADSPVLKAFREGQDLAGLFIFLASGLPSLVGSLAAAPLATVSGLVGGVVGSVATDKVVDNTTQYPNWQALAQLKFRLDPTTAAFTNPGGFIGGFIGGYSANKILKYLGHNLRQRIYLYMSPFSYQGANLPGINFNHKKEIGKIILSYLDLRKLYINDKKLPNWIKNTNISAMGIPQIGLTGEARAIFRDDAFRRALRLKPRFNTYKVNPDGSVSYNMNYVNSVRKGTGGTEFDVTDLEVFKHRAGDRYVTGDAVTSNGGHVNAKISDDFGSVTVEDRWDLLPFKDPKRLPNLYGFEKIMHKLNPNFEVLKFVGGDPFLLKQTFKIE